MTLYHPNLAEFQRICHILSYFSPALHNYNSDLLVQERCNSITNTLELRLPLIWLIDAISWWYTSSQHLCHLPFRFTWRQPCLILCMEYDLLFLIICISNDIIHGNEKSILYLMCYSICLQIDGFFYCMIFHGIIATPMFPFQRKST